MGGNIAPLPPPPPGYALHQSFTTQWATVGPSNGGSSRLRVIVSVRPICRPHDSDPWGGGGVVGGGGKGHFGDPLMRRCRMETTPRRSDWSGLVI